VDIATNMIQLAIMLGVGYAVGFRFQTGVLDVVAGIALLLLLGCAFSWVFAFLGLAASSPEAWNAYGFIIILPLTFASSAFVPVESMPSWLAAFAEVQFGRDDGGRDARALHRHPGRERRLGRRALGDRDHPRLRLALHLALPARAGPLAIRRSGDARPPRPGVDARTLGRNADGVPQPGPPEDVPIVMRCAWCDLYAVDGRWLPESALGPGGRQSASITHGICPPCAEAVQEAGRRH